MKRLRLLLLIPLLAMPLTAACASTPGSAVATPSTSEPAAASVEDLQDRFIAVIGSTAQSVVAIQTSTGLGSGVVFDSQGDIVTNAHVIAGASSYRVFLTGGSTYAAVLVGAFALDDLAVLRITAPNLKAATFGNSDEVRAGMIVMAIGSPLGLQGSVTEGIVSAVGRQVSESNGVALPPLIQTSASINPGNSGGALVDLDGAVIGITTLAAQDPEAGGTAPGIGFAIPSNIVKDIASQLIRDGRVTNTHRAFIGAEAATANGAQGAYLYSVTADGPAAKAGLQAGDVVTSIGGHQVVDQPSLASALSALQPGQTVTVVVRRGQSLLTFSITLGELPG